MPLSFSSAKSFLSRHRVRVATYGLLLVVILAAGGGLLYAKNQHDKSLATELTRQEAISKETSYIKKYGEVHSLIAAYKEKGGDAAAYTEKEAAIKSLIDKGNYSAADSAIKELTGQVKEATVTLEAANTQAAAAAQLEADKATVSGRVLEAGKPLEGATIRLSLGTELNLEATVGADGAYTFKVSPGSYTLVGTKAGYSNVSIDLVLAAKQVVSQDVALTKIPVATPTPTPKPKATATPKPTATATPSSPAAQSNGAGSYERKTVATSRGSFSVDVLTIDLTKARVITDSASNSECANNCATNSLLGYVNGNGGFAGINGTYFCPPDYSTCAGQANSYFWKVWDSGVGRAINANNGLGDNDPFLGFGTDGSARYFHSWSSFVSSGYSVNAGINCKPRLVEGGANVLSDADMDDKQRTTKSNRGAIGITGQTVYSIIAHNATVPDTAAILVAMGVQNAINLDGGGSSAMTFEGSYKVGPGRALPNAIIFKAR